MREINSIILHHTGTPKNTTVSSINKGHRNRWDNQSKTGYYIGYHYLILANGKVVQTRRDDEEGIHTYGHNNNSIGISLMGDFTIEDPNPKQIYALRDLLKQLVDDYNVTDIKGHRELTATACPGNLDLDFIRGLIIKDKKKTPTKKEAIYKKMDELKNLIDNL